MEVSYTYESFPRVACLAALELEQLANEETSHLQYVQKFVELINHNMSINIPNAQQQQNIDFASIDPLTGYAVNQALRSSIDNSIQLKNIEDLLSTIYKKITEPLRIVIESQNKSEKDYSKEDINALSSLCLAISKAYSSLQCNKDNFENHPFR